MQSQHLHVHEIRGENRPSLLPRFRAVHTTSRNTHVSKTNRNSSLFGRIASFLRQDYDMHCFPRQSGSKDHYHSQESLSYLREWEEQQDVTSVSADFHIIRDTINMKSTEPKPKKKKKGQAVLTWHPSRLAHWFCLSGRARVERVRNSSHCDFLLSLLSQYKRWDK